MQMPLLASIIMFISLIPTAQRNTHPGKQAKQPAELWCTGDDDLSQRMCHAFFTAFESTQYFDLQEENKPGNLIISIPENVGWKKVGKRMKIFYSVEFSTSDERVFMTRKGWCWHKQYDRCANQILRHARVATRRLAFQHTLIGPSK